MINQKECAAVNGATPNAALTAPIIPDKSTGFMFSVFTKDHGILTKIITYEDGQIKKDASECRMASGYVETVAVDNLLELKQRLSGLQQNQAISLGTVKNSKHGDRFRIVSKAKAQPGEITRSLEHMGWSEGHALVLIDVDIPKGAKALSLLETQKELLTLMPEFVRCEMLSMGSTSAGLIAPDGTTHEASGSHHYLVLENASMVPKLKELLKYRSWLSGSGYILVDKAGRLHEREFADSAVFSPERLSFEARPVMRDGVTAKPREVIHLQGGVVESLPSITDGERARADALIEAAKAQLRPRAETVETPTTPNTPKPILFEPPFFYYQASENQKESPWIKGELKDFDQIKANSAFHVSVYGHNGDTAKPKLSGDFWLDIDHKPTEGETIEAALQRSIDDLLNVLRYFNDLGVTPDNLRVYATGGKGFHVAVPWTVYATSLYYKNLNHIHKLWALEIVEATGSAGIDFALYAGGKGHLLRVENKQRANGRYKVPITGLEALQIDPATYLELTKNPRTVPPSADPQLCKPLADIFHRLQSDVLLAPNALPTLPSGAFDALGDEFPACIKQLVEHRDIKPGRDKFNQAKMTLASFICSSGTNGAAQQQLIERLSASWDSDNNPTKDARVRAVISAIKSMTNSGNEFSCTGASSMFLTSPCEGCPIKQQTKAIEGELLPKSESAINRQTAPATEFEMVERLLDAIQGNLIYIFDRNLWVVWRDRWEIDPNAAEIVQQYERLAKALAQEAFDRLFDGSGNQAAVRLSMEWQTAKRLNNVITLLKKKQSICRSWLDFDSDPLLFQFNNGVVNLKTGEFRKAKKTDLCLQTSPVDYDLKADCLNFKTFLTVASCNNSEWVDYMQLVAGYLMVGHANEEKFWIHHGAGANGKTTCENAFRTVLGEYAASAEPSLLVNRDERAASNDIAALASKRAVFVNELEEDGDLNVTAMKRLCSNAVLRCRFLYQESFEFKPMFKLMVSTNYKPRTRQSDRGTWRRIALVGWYADIEKTQGSLDKSFFDSKLVPELPGIAAWMVEGAKRYLRDGLVEPACIADATEAYRQESDVYLGWFGDRLEQSGAWEPLSTGDLFNDFKGWFSEMYGGECKATARSLGHWLSNKGFQPERFYKAGKLVRGYKGLKFQKA